MITINGDENNFLKFEIECYQFSDISNCQSKYDKNWLWSKSEVKNSKYYWKAENTCFLTFDIQKIIDMLKLYINNYDIKSQPLEFIEPSLIFEYVGILDGIMRFKIKFLRKFLPKVVTNYEDYFFEFGLDNNELELLINSFQKELSKYPIRL